MGRDETAVDLVAERRRQRRRVLNKWQLARFLMANPSLAVYRKHRTATIGLDDIDGLTVSSIGKLKACWGRGLATRRHAGDGVGYAGEQWSESVVGLQVNEAVGLAGAYVGGYTGGTARKAAGGLKASGGAVEHSGRYVGTKTVESTAPLLSKAAGGLKASGGAVEHSGRYVSSKTVEYAAPPL
eukprot:2076712-Prymnesium_polylepis.1